VQFYSPTDVVNCSTVSTGAIFPTIGNNWPIATSSAVNSCLINVTKSVKGHVTNANPILFPNDKNGGTFDPLSSSTEVGYTPLMQYCLDYTGYAQNFRT